MSKKNDLKAKIKKPSPAVEFFNTFKDNNIDNNENNNTNVSSDENNFDIINNIVNAKNDKPKKILTGIYFDPDVEKVLNKLAKKGGKGAKSKIVNELVKEGFIKRGLL